MTPENKEALKAVGGFFFQVAVILIGIVISSIIIFTLYSNQLKVIDLTECLEISGTTKIQQLETKQRFLEEACRRICFSDEFCKYDCEHGFVE